MTTLTISKQTFFNNGNLILPCLTDKAGTLIETGIRTWLCQDYDIITKVHTEKGISYIGYDATDVNKKLREQMDSIVGIHKETHIEYGALFHDTKKGFDFSLYDEQYNYRILRNAFMGYPGRYNGNVELVKLHKPLKLIKTEWERMIADMGGTPGENLDEDKNCMTIVGELQFGNWALVKHDLLRLLNSSESLPIDFYVYIAPTGELESKLSKGIVTYDKVIDAVMENKRIIKTPMWIIGLDIA